MTNNKKPNIPREKRQLQAEIYGFFNPTVYRYINNNFSGAEARGLDRIYTSLCRIDNDFHARENKSSNMQIRSVINLCVKYARCSRSTAIKYCNTLRDHGFIDYGQNTDEKGFKVGKAFLDMYSSKDAEKYRKIMGSAHIRTSAKKPNKNEEVLVHGHPHKERSVRTTTERTNIKRERTILKEKEIKEDKSSFIVPSDDGKVRVTIIPNTKKKKPKPSFAKEKKTSPEKESKPLDSWIDVDLNGNGKYLYPTKKARTLLYSKKYKPSSIGYIKPIVDHWNLVTKDLQIHRGLKFNSPVHMHHTKIMYRFQIAATYCEKILKLPKEDIIRAIDNYADILTNSHFYQYVYDFDVFVLYKKDLFDVCLTGEHRKSKSMSYFGFKFKEKRMPLTKDVIREREIVKFRKQYGRDPEGREDMTYIQSRVMDEMRKAA